MSLLLLGLLLFIVLHMVPYWGVRARTGAVERMGAVPYKILFALATFGSFVLMVNGWKSTDVSLFYDAPTWGRHVTPLFVLAGFILFFAPNAPTNIKRIIRHPQLMGVILWGFGHLLSNGENRSVVLFAGMMFYSLLAMAAANRRDGEWKKPDAVPYSRDVILAVVGLVLYGAFAYFHEWIIGVPAVG